MKKLKYEDVEPYLFIISFVALIVAVLIDENFTLSSDLLLWFKKIF